MTEFSSPPPCPSRSPAQRAGDGYGALQKEVPLLSPPRPSGLGVRAGSLTVGSAEDAEERQLQDSLERRRRRWRCTCSRERTAPGRAARRGVRGCTPRPSARYTGRRAAGASRAPRTPTHWPRPRSWASRAGRGTARGQLKCPRAVSGGQGRRAAPSLHRRLTESGGRVSQSAPGEGGLPQVSAAQTLRQAPSQGCRMLGTA